MCVVDELDQNILELNAPEDMRVIQCSEESGELDILVQSGAEESEFEDTDDLHNLQSHYTLSQGKR